MYLGANALSGLKKFYPSCRRSLEVSAHLLKNWSKTVIRERALPLPAEFTKALAAVAIRQGDEKFGIALLLGSPMDAFQKLLFARLGTPTLDFGSVRSAVVGVARLAGW